MNRLKIVLNLTVCLVMQKAFAQNVGIGTNTPQWPLHLVANVDGIAFRIENNNPLGSSGLWVNVRGEEGAAITARAENPDGTAAPVPFGSYAVRGVAGEGKIAMGAFATNGIAVRAISGANGLAISSSGNIRLAGIGEAAGKVLMSDASGNATWQSLQVNNMGGWSTGGNAGITNSNFIGTTSDMALRFRTNNTERMLIYGNGNIGVGTTSTPTSKLEVYSENTAFAAVEATNYTANAKSAVFGRTRNAQSGGAIYGFAIQDGSGLPSIGNAVYAVIGEGMGTNRGVGAFSFSGTALFAGSNSGLAMHTSGGVRLQGIGESAGKLLVSDASGNASWQNPVKITVDQPGAAGLPSLEFRNGGTYRGAFGWSQTDGRFFFYDGESNTNALFINNGRVGIGNRNPTTNTLEVNGTASKATAGDWLANSDARLKKNITPLSNALQRVLQLKGITYEWNDDQTGSTRPGGSQMGFTAQNIQQVFPQLVSTDAQGFLQTAYGTYDALYVEAIRELLQKITLLEKRLAVLEK